MSESVRLTERIRRRPRLAVLGFAIGFLAAMAAANAVENDPQNLETTAVLVVVLGALGLAVWLDER